MAAEVHSNREQLEEILGQDGGTDDATQEVPPKRRRKRVKKLCSLIQDQMEFYFSDANLHRDRFLKKQIDQSSDGFIDLDVFTNFNKIQNLTTDVTLIAKSLTNSELLKVSDDKKKVRRVTPLAARNDADDRTVYVECLPSTTDHDYLKKVFSNCGQVLYVSLPKYRTSGDIKGFAFIEFGSKEAAQKACELMNNPPAGAGSKVGKFPKSSKQLDTLNKQMAAQKTVGSEETEADLVKNKRRKRSRSGSDSAGEDKAEERPQRKGRKSRASQSESGREESTPVASKRKPSLQDDNKDGIQKLEKVKNKDKIPKDQNRKQSEDAETEEEGTPSKRLKQEIKTETCESANTTCVTSEPVSADKSEADYKQTVTTPIKQESIMKKDPEMNGGDAKRKRKSEGGDGLEVKKVRISEKVEVKVAEDEGKKRRKKKKKKKDVKQDLDLPELRVMPKSEWLELKKEYIKLQKESMRDLKQALCKHKLKEQASKIVGLRGSKIEHMEEDTLEEKKESRTLEFTPNVILKISSPTEICRKQLKEAVKSCGEIAYVDVPEGQCEGFVRCPDPENAASIAEAMVSGYTFQKLEGEEEKTYWEKIIADREKRLQTKTRTKRRGRDKVMKQADRATMEINKKKHVFF